MTISNVAAVDNTAAITVNNKVCLNIIYDGAMHFQHLEQCCFIDDFVLHLDAIDAIKLLQEMRNVLLKNHGVLLKHNGHTVTVRSTLQNSSISAEIAGTNLLHKFVKPIITYTVYTDGKSVIDGITECALGIMRELNPAA